MRCHMEEAGSAGAVWVWAAVWAWFVVTRTPSAAFIPGFREGGGLTVEATTHPRHPADMVLVRHIPSGKNLGSHIS